MNGGDKTKTELFKSITTAYQSLIEMAKHADVASNAPTNTKRPLRTDFARTGVVPPRHVYNVAAWNDAHYGSTTAYSNQYTSTENFIRNHPANSSTSTNNAFMRGMESNKTYQHTRRMEEKRRNDNNNDAT